MLPQSRKAISRDISRKHRPDFIHFAAVYVETTAPIMWKETFVVATAFASVKNFYSYVRGPSYVRTPNCKIYHVCFCTQPITTKTNYGKPTY